MNHRFAMADEVALAKAIAYLGAVEVAQAGDKTAGGSIAKTTIYAAKSPTSGTYLCTDAPGLVAMVDASAKPTDYAEMPSWWTPESRFAWRCGSIAFETENAARLYRRDLWPELDFPVTRITADLETGAEVPA